MNKILVDNKRVSRNPTCINYLSYVTPNITVTVTRLTVSQLGWEINFALVGIQIQRGGSTDDC